jgi:hypothetical protein
MHTIVTCIADSSVLFSRGKEAELPCRHTEVGDHCLRYVPAYYLNSFIPSDVKGLE